MADRSDIATATLDKIPVGLFAVDRAWRVMLWNNAFATWTGIRSAEALGRDARELLPKLGSPRYAGRLEFLLEGGPPVVFSYQLNADLFPEARERPHARVRHCTASSLPGMEGILFTIEDMTEIAALIRQAKSDLALRLEAERELRSALAAKEMLMREASHRVKNNLTMILGLIDLESSRSSDPTFQAAFADFAARIESVALIHELLYKGDPGAEVELDDYLASLARNMHGTFSRKGAVRLELDLAQISLGVDATLYVGLVVSELLTNSFKYVFSPNLGSLLRLSLRREGQDVVIVVCDDGPGFPPGFSAKGPSVSSAGSLGWGLVQMLCDALGGSAMILPGPGGIVELRFPLIPERKAP